MRRKYDGSAIQRRHPGQAEPRPEAWRLEEERGARLDCRCPECVAIRREVQAELRTWRRQSRKVQHNQRQREPVRHDPPTYFGLDTTVINRDIRTGFEGIANNADSLAETFRQLTEQLGTTLWGSDTGVYYATSPATEERNRQRAEANKRAEDLLASLLTPEQQEAWRTVYCFTITAPSGNRYELHGRTTYRLDEAGRRAASYCLVSRGGGLPVADVVASRLLLLQANEELFLRLANRSVVSIVGGGMTWYGEAVGWTPFVWNHG